MKRPPAFAHRAPHELGPPQCVQPRPRQLVGCQEPTQIVRDGHQRTVGEWPRPNRIHLSVPHVEERPLPELGGGAGRPKRGAGLHALSEAPRAHVRDAPAHEIDRRREGRIVVVGRPGQEAPQRGLARRHRVHQPHFGLEVVELDVDVIVARCHEACGRPRRRNVTKP